MDKVGEVAQLNFLKPAKRDFEITDPSELCPMLRRFLRQVHNLQIIQLSQKQYDELDKYLRFLLRFSLQNEELCNSRQFCAFKLDEVYTNLTDKTLFNVDMKIITKTITMTGRRGDTWAETRRIVEVKPTLEEIYTTLTMVSERIQSNFTELPRIEKLVYPNMEFEEGEEYLEAKIVPTLNNDGLVDSLVEDE
jgi:hypothetical protein